MAAQQAKHSSVDKHHTKPLAELKGVNSIAGARTIEYKMVGVLVHGIGYYLYIADPRIPHNGNLTIVQLQQAPEELSLELKRPDVPPVYHNQGWSQGQRDAAEMTYLEKYRAEIKNDPESLAFCEAADKEIKRATKNMHSKAALIPELERQVKEQVMGRMSLESNAPKLYDCDILGGAVHHNCMLYLINTGHEVVWVHDHQVDQTALDSVRENIVGKAITVWWHDKKRASKPTGYSGTIMMFREDQGDRHEVLYEDEQVDFLQLLTLDVEHDRDDEDSIIRVMWMLQRPDLDADTLSKQLDIDKVKKYHKRKAQFNRSKKSEAAPKKRQTKPLAKKKRKKPKREPELSENSDASLELSSELEESDEEQPTAKAATATGAQAQTNKRRYPRRDRKKCVEINIDHPKFREEGTWGASDNQRKKKKAV